MRTERRPGGGTGSADGPAVAQAAMAAEAHHARMIGLQAMTPVQLRAVLTGDPAEAGRWVESAARYGVVAAQLRLGQMRLDGTGGPRDPAAARRWFARAARQGSADGMNMLGRCHENGWGAPVDLKAAARWYARAAEAGHDWGEYNYANLLFDGRGVPRDQAEAAAFYRRAAERGHTRAMNLLARCYEEGWGVSHDRVAAADWYRRAAEGGYFRAQYNYATVLVGMGRIDAALDWFERACRGAAPDSLAVMTEGMLRFPNPRLAALARRFADGEATPRAATAEGPSS